MTFIDLTDCFTYLFAIYLVFVLTAWKTFQRLFTLSEQRNADKRTDDELKPHDF